MKREISQDVIDYLRKNMPEQYKEFFRKVWSRYGELNVCYKFDEEDLEEFRKHESDLTLEKLNSIPHPVHLREGMTIRNNLRGSGVCKDWDEQTNDYDDNWIAAVIAALELGKDD